MWLTYAVALWFSAVVFHALACRLSMPCGSVPRFLVVGSGSGLCLAWLVWDRYGILAPQTLSALLAYSFLCELYIFLSTTALYSVSATLLLALRHQQCTEKDLADIYDSSTMVSRRIERLLSVGLLCEVGGELRLTRNGRRLASRFVAIKQFLGHSLDLPDTGMERHRG